MKQRYEPLEHMADIRVRAYGDTLNELFANAAYAMFDNMAALQNVKPVVKTEVAVSADNLENLLVAWLSELLFLFETKQWLLVEFDVKRVDEKEMRAEVRGEKYDAARHEFYTEIKAVTYHQLKVEKVNQHWVAEIIFDI